MGKIIHNKVSILCKKSYVLIIMLFLLQALTFSQTISISGLVKNSLSSEAVSGVTVSANSVEVITDENGAFYFISESGFDSLLFNAEGFIARKIKIGEDKEILVFLQPDIVYAASEKLYLTHQLEGGSIHSKNTWFAIPDHALSGLNGRISGIGISNFSGAPADQPSINIRGVNSMIFNQSPTILLDGTPIDRITDINQYDVSEISIIKDASSLAIMGGQGSNGTILIRTKRGETARNKANFSASYGIQSLEKQIEMLSSEQQIDFIRDLNDGLSGTPEDRSIFFGNNFVSDSMVDLTNPYHNDMQKLLFSPAPYQNYNLTFSGGSNDTRFLVSASYFRLQGIIAPSAMQRMNVLFNLDQVVSEKLTIGTSMYLTKMNNQRVSTLGSAEDGNVILSALAYPSFVPTKDSDGMPFINPLRPEIDNPIANKEGHEDYFSRNSAVASFFLNYTILEHLKFQFNTSGNLALDRRDYFASVNKTHFGRTKQGYGIQSGKESTSWNNEALLNFAKANDIASFDMVAGALYYKSRNAWNFAEGWGFPTDAVKLLSGAGTTVAMSNTNDYSRTAYLSRLSLGLGEKYFLRANIRAEQSSRFNDKLKTGLFYGLNASYVISEENFMSGLSSVNNLQLNLSYGLTGNDGGNMAGLLYPMFAKDTIIPLNPDETHTIVRYPDAGFSAQNIQDQTWELTSEYSVGISSGLFGNKVLFSGTWFKRSITDLILPDLSQSSIAYINGGELTSNGTEINLRLQNLSIGQVKWTHGICFTQLSNEVINTENFPNGYLIGYNGSSNIIKKGESLYTFWGYETDGIFQDQNEVDNHPLQTGAEMGDIRYKNQNTDNVIDENDKVVIGNPNPDFYLGIDNTFVLKGFEINILLQGAFGADRLNLVKMQTEGSNDFINMSAAVADRWTPGSGKNVVPRASTGSHNNQISDRFIEKADYLRVKQATLGYNLPARYLDKLGLSGVYLYLTGSNLFTFTSYSGFDPESSSYDVLGIDYGAYPNARSFGCGMRLGF